MEEGVLSYKGNIFDERAVLDKAYKKVKVAHETSKRSYYKTILSDELTCFPVFMQKWFRLAKVDPKTSVGLAHEQEYEQFRAIYYALRHEYGTKYRCRNLRALLQLIINQDDTMFQKELKDKNFSYLYFEYGMLDYELINKIMDRANILQSDIVNKNKIKLLITACNELEKEDLSKRKTDIVLRENILNPFDNLNIK